VGLGRRLGVPYLVSTVADLQGWRKEPCMTKDPLQSRAETGKWKPGAVGRRRTGRHYAARASCSNVCISARTR